MADVDDKVVKQVEYYFGDINLPKDRFLQEEMRMNGDGWVRLSELMKFNRLKQLCGDDARVMDILAAKCGLLEVDANERRVRRRPERALPRDKVAFARDLLPRSVYVKGFRRDATLDEIQAFFVRCGVEAEAIRMRRRRNAAAKGGPRQSESEDDDEDDDKPEAPVTGEKTSETAEPDAQADATKPKETEPKPSAGNHPFKGSVFVVFRTAADAERFVKAPQSSGDEKADAELFDASVPFEKKPKAQYFREKKQDTKAKRRAVQNAFESAKKGKGDAARQGNDGEGAQSGERQFERGMLLRLSDVPQALLDFNELKKLFSKGDVEIFADLIPASNAAVVRIKRAPSGLEKTDQKLVGAIIWDKLCTEFGSVQPEAKPEGQSDVKPEGDATAESVSANKLSVLKYKGNQLNAEVIVGEEENRYWKDLFAKWEAGGPNKQSRKGGKNKQMGKRGGKRKWNDKGKRNGRKQRDGDNDDYGSEGETHNKRARDDDDE